MILYRQGNPYFGHICSDKVYIVEHELPSSQLYNILAMVCLQKGILLIAYSQIVPPQRVYPRIKRCTFMLKRK